MIGAAFPIFNPAIGVAGGPQPGRYFRAGYGFRRRVIVPAAVHRLVTSDGSVILPFLETAGWLKSVANGGNIASGLGHDIVFETDSGQKYPHHVASYDPVAGRLEAWVRLPPFAPGANVAYAIAYNNPAVTSPEGSAAATWAGFRLSINMATGEDASETATTLTLTDVVAATFLNLAAGDFSG